MTVTPEQESHATAHLDLFRYLTAVERVEYIAIMNQVTSSLLGDMSAGVIADHLAAAGVDLTRDTVESRCEQLAEWGNLVPSNREAKADTVADYLRARSRFQVSSLGGRVHRGAVAIMDAGDGAREVARELLGQISDSLTRVAAIVDAPAGERDDDTLSGLVTTIFNNQRLFTASVTDFYAYLSGVLSRFDLGSDEYTEFKSLLLDYVDLITADVNRHSPVVAATLDALDIDALLGALGAVPGLALGDAADVERSVGRSREDWEQLRTWYSGHGEDSGPVQLRAAAGRALGQLLANAKRQLDSSHTGYSRRADLLRLASWFDDASNDEAERLFAATFGAHPTRHLLLGPDEPDPRVGTGTSWWTADPITVPVSLRDRGDRVSHGRVSRVPDPTADRRRVHEMAVADSHRTHDAAIELVDIGTLTGARISPVARGVLLDQLARLLAAQDDPTQDGDWVDSDLGLRVHAAHGGDTVLHSSDGSMTVHGLMLTVHPATTDSAELGRQPQRRAR